MTSEQPTPNVSGQELTELIQQASNDLDETCIQRHLVGQKKYGDFTFFDADTVEMAMEEVADTMNYMRYTWIKLWLLQRSIHRIVQEHPAADTQGFVPLKDI